MIDRCLDKIKATPYPFQRKGANFMLKHRWVLLGDEQGLGKTLQTIMAIVATGQKAIVICPGMLRSVWLGEVRKFTDLEPIAVHSSKQTNYLSRRWDVLITSYELAEQVVAPELGAEVLVLDECHYIKNMKAVRTKFIHWYAQKKQPQYVFALSGTPIKNGVGEFYSILKLLSYNPQTTNGLRVKEKSAYSFSCKFSYSVTEQIMGRSVTKFEGVRNVSALKRYLTQKYLRRTSESELELPSLIIKEVNLATANIKVEEELEQAYDLWLLDGKMGPHISQAKMGAAMEKVPATAKYVMDILEQGEKVVIFSDHVDPIASFRDIFQDKGYKVGILTGGIPEKERARSIEDFQKGGTGVILATIGAASTGITLTAAKNLIFNDISWVPADIEQAQKRIHRIGQKDLCIIHRMVLGPIDKAITKKIIEKREVLKKVL